MPAASKMQVEQRGRQLRTYVKLQNATQNVIEQARPRSRR